MRHDPSRRRWLVFAYIALAINALALFVPSGVSAPTFPHTDKLVHAILFAAPVVGALRGGLGLGPTIVSMLAYAAASEIVQAGLLPGRSGSLADVAADVTGVAAGVYLASRWPARRRHVARR